jgi:amino acid adenylation domain-containing protein
MQSGTYLGTPWRTAYITGRENYLAGEISLPADHGGIGGNFNRTLTTHDRSLFDCFRAGHAANPDGVCIDVGGRSMTYSEVAQSVSNVLGGLSAVQDDAVVAGVYAEREAALFLGLLASLAWDKGYVPISPEFPDQRSRDIISQSGVNTIFTSPSQVDRLVEVLGAAADRYNLIVLGDEDFDTGTVRGIAALAPGSGAPASEADALTYWTPKNDFAYLMFTSGSTGAPKGVPITHSNACQFVDVMQKMYQLRRDDRVICLPDFYFDLSIFPIWVTWNAGGALYMPTNKEKLMPVSYATRNRISVWCSVPSAISFLIQFRALKAGLFPDIRLSVFCGEPLLKAEVAQWLGACPNSKVDNLYGPTEVTVFSTVFPVTAETLDHGPGDVVSIGKAMEGVDTCIVDDDLTPVPPGTIGELCLAGGQVAPGYWNNPELSAEKFCRINAGDPERIWYRTGDVALEAEDGNLVFKGRVDDQVQVSGYRVELGDIEQAARQSAGVTAAASVYVAEAGARNKAIFMFVVGRDLRPEAIRAELGNLLPAYMRPKEIFVIEQMPQNKNGKTDKTALKQMLQEPK